VGIEYRRVDSEEAVKTALRQQALAKEREVYAQEIEVERQKRLTKLAGDKNAEIRAGAKRMLEVRSETVVEDRAYADSLGKQAGLTEYDRRAVHIEQLDSWIGALENEHVNLVTRFQLAKDRKANDEADTLSKDIAVVEDAHRYATSEYDRLVVEQNKIEPESDDE
jgi:hypothetical protein